MTRKVWAAAENPLGIDMTVVDEAGLMEETGGTGAHVHIVIRVADMRAKPYPALAKRRFKVRCVDCREQCWFDPLSTPAPGLGTILCLRCLRVRLEQDPEGLGLGLG